MKKLHLLLFCISINVFAGTLAGQEPWLMKDDFVDNRNKWVITDDTSLQTSFSDGKYHIRTKKAIPFTITKPIDFDASHDFKIEATFKLISSPNLNSLFGLSFGNSNEKKQGYEFLINGNGVYLMRQENTIEGPGDGRHIILTGTGKENKLTVIHREGLWEFQINDARVFTSKVYPFAGNRTGFFIGDNSQIAISSFKIYDWTLAKGLPANQKEPLVSTKLFDNFFDNRNNWNIKGGASTDISLNKQYTFNHKTDGYYYTWKYSDISAWDNYLIEMEFQHESGMNDWGYGFTFGFKDIETYYAFIIADGWYKIHKWEKGEETKYVNWTEDGVIRKGDFTPNVLRLMDVGNEWRFYVNGKLLTTMPAKSLFDRYFGIVVEYKQKISVNYVKTAVLHYLKD